MAELAQPPASPNSEKQKESDAPAAAAAGAGAGAVPVDDGDPRMALSRKNVAAARADKSGRVYRLYCDGIFDLFHIGHMRMLEQAKKALDGTGARVTLIAGVNTDVDTHKYKGKTVMNHRTRCDSVRHCKWVDEVVEDAPWIVDAAFLAKHRIDFVCHDALPYKDTSGTAPDGDVYSGLKKMGKFLETQRTDGISTSDLIIQICRDYDDYVRRNLERGYTAKELGVGNTWVLRSAAHDKRKKVDANYAAVKEEMAEVSQAAKLFVEQFNPKWLVDREGEGGNGGADGATGKGAPGGERKVRFTPKRYVQHLKGVPGASSALLHHSVGLAKAVFHLTWNCLSYAIPCCYCGFLCQSKKKKKA